MIILLKCKHDHWSKITGNNPIPNCTFLYSPLSKFADFSVCWNTKVFTKIGIPFILIYNENINPFILIYNENINPLFSFTMKI